MKKCRNVKGNILAKEMEELLNFKSITTRLGFVMVCVSFITTICTGGVFVWYTLRENAQNLSDYRNELEEEMEHRLVSETEVAMSVIKKFYSLQQAGEMTEEQAKERAAAFIRSLRYDDGNGYFWIDTYDGVNVVMSKREYEGKNRIQLKDNEGREFIREMIETGKRPGGGFTDIKFEKSYGSEPLPKRTFTISFDPYQWILGTGEWMDRIDILVDDYEIEMDIQFREKMLKVLLYLLLLQSVFLFMAYSAGKSLAQPLLFMTKRLQAMGESDFSLTELDEIHLKSLFARRDELGSMSRAMKETHKKLSEYQKLILDMARNDALTGLANRRYFHEYVSRLKRDKYLTLIALDLDHFKEVNDNYDHQTGDAALLILAEVLKQSFPDALNVRLGGDEFMVVLTKECELSDVGDRVQMFMDNLISIYRMDMELTSLTISAGIARLEDERQPFELLMQQSDAALYRAKQEGRSCYVVYEKGMELNEDGK